MFRTHGGIMFSFIIFVRNERVVECSTKMRCNIVSAIGHNSRQVRHLQRDDADLALSDAHRTKIAERPLFFAVDAVVKRHRRYQTFVATRKVNA